MKFTPKLPESNVNVSRTHPLTEFAWLLGGLALLIGSIYLFLGFTTNWIADNTSVEIEHWLGQQALQQFPSEQTIELQDELQVLLNALPSDSPLHSYNFKVSLVSNSDVNAVALPGGNILVFSGLLEQVESKNELAMILAHELGHYAHRDHLKGLGRTLGLAVLVGLVFGNDSSSGGLISQALFSFQVRYSQQQEAAADIFGLDLLVASYGHAGGASDFFLRAARKAGSRIPYLLASHPHPEARSEQLQQRITASNYSIDPTLPLGDAILQLRNKTAAPDLL